jgi:hypothetical protein
MAAGILQPAAQIRKWNAAVSWLLLLPPPQKSFQSRWVGWKLTHKGNLLFINLIRYLMIKKNHIFKEDFGWLA